VASGANRQAEEKRGCIQFLKYYNTVACKLDPTSRPLFFGGIYGKGAQEEAAHGAAYRCDFARGAQNQPFCPQIKNLNETLGNGEHNE